MENARIVAVLEEVADLLQLQEANPFRVRAYRNAARVLSEETTPLRKRVASGEDLTKLPSIGREMAAHVEELVETGELRLLDELGSEVPRSLVEVMALPGLGPKKAARLWKELGVESVEDLAAAVQAGTVAGLSGFGRKTELQLARAMTQHQRHRGRFKLVEADRMAAPLLEQLAVADGVRRVEIAGSFRRRRETVGDLDILVVAPRSEAVMDCLVSYPEVSEVRLAGDTRATVILEKGLQVDLRVVPARSYGAALIYFTGSKPHNIKLRQRALERGFHLSEYGLFEPEEEASVSTGEERDAQGSGRFVSGMTEKAVYRALGLPWIAPELREDRGEMAAAAEKRLPRPIELADLRGDLQMHSTWSDGKSSIEEMVTAAAARGYEYIAMTDHSPYLGVVGGLDAKRLRLQWQEIEAVEERHPEIRILRGQEVDILPDGSLDQTDDAMAELDLVVAAVHSQYDLAPAEQTRRILKALRHPAVHVLAHPTARKINQRPGMDFDLDAILDCAFEEGVAVELNALPSRLDLRDTHAMRARELGVKIVISTDAHHVRDLDAMRYGIDQARRAWLEPGDVLNTLPLSKLLENLRQ
ncbi:MAG: DNA polymerase/3'-5' exonuclease PolX [Acidobacteriota bacterium]|nr:DNA polymerase/3'-5' exonuclease PolX [Acidobacteriota bacterium]